MILPAMASPASCGCTTTGVTGTGDRVRSRLISCMYELGGYKNAADYFQRALGENARNASRYIRVARLASPAEEELYGVTKLDAGLSFIEAKIGDVPAHPPLPIAFDKLRVPVAGGGWVPFKDARLEDLAAATRALSKRPPTPSSHAERALAETFAKHPSFKGVRVRVRNGLASLVGIPIAALEVLGTLLHRTKWSAHEAPAPARAKAAKKPTRRGTKR